MASRLELHEKFCEVLGTRNVYFNPPESVKMSYDAIRYQSAGKDTKHANDMVYMNTNRYEGVYITRESDSTVPDEMISRFKMCSFGSPYKADNLNHHPFTLYY